MATDNIILFDYGWNDEIKQKALLPLEVSLWFACYSLFIMIEKLTNILMIYSWFLYLYLRKWWMKNSKGKTFLIKRNTFQSIRKDLQFLNLSLNIIIQSST